MSGDTGERPFSDILTSIRYWVRQVHAIVVIFGFLLWSLGPGRILNPPTNPSQGALRSLTIGTNIVAYVRNNSAYATKIGTNVVTSLSNNSTYVTNQVERVAASSIKVVSRLEKSPICEALRAIHRERIRSVIRILARERIRSVIRILADHIESKATRSLTAHIESNATRSLAAHIKSKISMNGILIPHMGRRAMENETGVERFLSENLPPSETTNIEEAIDRRYIPLRDTMDADMYESRNEIPGRTEPVVLFRPGRINYPLGVPPSNTQLRKTALAGRLTINFGTGQLPRMNNRLPVVVEQLPANMPPISFEYFPDLMIFEGQDESFTRRRRDGHPDLIYPYNQSRRYNNDEHIYLIERSLQYFVKDLQVSMTVYDHECYTGLKECANRFQRTGRFVLSRREAETFHTGSLAYGVKGRIYREVVEKLPTFAQNFSRHRATVMDYRDVSLFSWAVDVYQQEVLSDHLAYEQKIPVNTPIPVTWTENIINC